MKKSNLLHLRFLRHTFPSYDQKDKRFIQCTIHNSQCIIGFARGDLSDRTEGQKASCDVTLRDFARRETNEKQQIKQMNRSWTAILSIMGNSSPNPGLCTATWNT